MSTTVRAVEYFYATVRSSPGGGYEIFDQLADEGVNLLATHAMPVGPTHIQLALFPADSHLLIRAAEKTALTLTGPQHAILVQGEDKPGVVAAVLRKLHDASVQVFASNGVSAGDGRFGYILFVRPEEVEKAQRALGVSNHR